MKWWYENECEECKKEFYSKPYDHREAGAGQIGYCINCPNSGIKERVMEFDKSRVYTALNADELKAGDKVIVAIDDAPTVDLWHYPSRGELPDKDVECLVRTKLGNNFIAMIDGSDNCWCTGEFFGEYLEDDCVACWQYIVPPKEEV